MGLCKKLGNNDRAASIVGTFDYIAPEVLQRQGYGNHMHISHTIGLISFCLSRIRVRLVECWCVSCLQIFIFYSFLKAWSCSSVWSGSHPSPLRLRWTFVAKSCAGITFSRSLAMYFCVCHPPVSTLCYNLPAMLPRGDRIIFGLQFAYNTKVRNQWKGCS